ncbi:MAG TPA: peptidyl-prolyl cis-trans isomerase [Bacillota bacterium]|nr:peptidyl-prolyl cis-trans isomerase [Bacillota bacterium]
MSEIVQILGNVKHPITLDPNLWIFDDRKKRLPEFFNGKKQEDEQTIYAENMARLWEKSLEEGVAPTTQSEALFVHKKDISGDWGIPFRPFLNNAIPTENASKVMCFLSTKEKIEIPLTVALESILCFAIDGQPISGEDGPIHLYYGDGSNRDHPINGIQSFEIK